MCVRILLLNDWIVLIARRNSSITINYGAEMKIFLAALALSQTFAFATQAEDLKLADYRGIKDVEGFYVRQGEMANPALASAPEAVRSCIGHGMVEVAGESRNRAAQSCVTDPTQENLDAFNWVDLATITRETQAAARAVVEKCAALAN